MDITALDDATHAHLQETLSLGEMTIHGQISTASNTTLFVSLAHGGESTTAVYKPARGARALHDFDATTLAAREVCAYELSRAAGWDCVPLTVWREDLQLGAGSLQKYVEESEPDVVDVVVLAEGDSLQPGFVVAVEGEDETGEPVALVHRDSSILRLIHLFDVVINNADRKGGHLLSKGDRVYAIDNGLSFHADPKLRTVLWGWAGDALTQAERDLLTATASVSNPNSGLHLCDQTLSADEWRALQARIAELLDNPVMPHPDPYRNVLPWPVF